MKKINLLTLAFVVLYILTASAQKNNTKTINVKSLYSKSTNQKTTNQKSTNTKSINVKSLYSKSTNQKSTNTKSTYFEGVITVVCSITMDNKKTKKTFGMSDNGEFIDTIYIKGKRKKEFDTRLKLILIEDKIEDMAYYWSPETKEGIKYCLSQNHKDKDVNYNRDSSADVCLGEKKEMFGFELEKWRKSKTTKVETDGSYLTHESTIEYWAYPGWGPEYYGFQRLIGFAFEMEWFQKTMAPMKKKSVIHQYYQVTNVERKAIPESEFKIPKDITFKLCKGCQEVYEQQNELAQSVQKYRKKHGIDTNAGVKTKGAAQIKGEWEY